MALAVTAFLATKPVSAQDCYSSCLTDETQCIIKCGADEDCAVKCVKAAVGCVCGCIPAMTRKLPNSTSAAEARDSILRLAGTRSALTDLTVCLNSAANDGNTCITNCRMDASCVEKCAETMLDKTCKCGAASLQAGVLVALAALLSWMARM